MLLFFTSIKSLTSYNWSNKRESLFFENLSKNVRHAVAYADYVHTCTYVALASTKYKDRLTHKKRAPIFFYFFSIQALQWHSYYPEVDLGPRKTSKMIFFAKIVNMIKPLP